MAGRPLNTKALWSAAITVAVLAFVLIVLGTIGPLGGKKQAPPGATPDVSRPIDESEPLYQQALQAQASGDLTRTVDLARQALKLNPNNAAARALITAVTEQQAKGSTQTTPSASADTSGTSQESSATAALYLKAYKPLAVLLPTVVEGFDLGPASERGADVTRAGSPKEGGTPVSSVLWSVHDRGSKKNAGTFIGKVTKRAFPKNGASTTVNGVAGYFGTDGTQVATVVFAKGRYVYEVNASAVPGVNPSKARAIALKVAEVFPVPPSN